MSWFKRKFENWCYRHLPGTIDWLTDLTNRYPAKLIANANAKRILIDNSVLGHAVTHETAWISTGEELWGGKIPFDSGYAARIPVFSEQTDTEVYRSVLYIHAIARLARKGGVELYTSPELADERMTQPFGRFAGYGFSDFNVFSDVEIPLLDDAGYHVTLFSDKDTPSVEQQRADRLQMKTEQLFQALVSALGQKNSQDAYHISFAERSGCFCFLTMDFKLVRSIRSQSGHPAVRGLKVEVLTPQEYGERFKLTKIPPRLLSYHGRPWFVEVSTNWPDSKRNRRR